MIDRKSKRCGSILLVLPTLALWASGGQAFSQSAPTPPPRQVFYSKVEPLTDTIDRVATDPRPKTADGALQALDWLIYGNVAAGAVYDSNVFSSPNEQAAYGARFQPYIVAARNTGIQRTLVYGRGDVRYFPSQGRTDLIDTAAGVAHVWEIQRDLVFRGQLEALRGQQNSSLVSAVNGPSVYYTEPVKYTSLFGSTSIEKSFGQFFTAIGGSLTGNAYDDTKDSLGNVIDEQFQNGTRTTLNARIGYNISPIIYTFIEPSANWGQFKATNLNSNGYQIVGGLGTARISLFNGEIYAGVLTQHFNDPTTPTLSQPVYGGRVSWYPTRFVTVTGSFDQTLGTSDFSPNVFKAGSATMVNTSKLVASWAVLRDVSLEGSVEFRHYEYLSVSRLDDLRLIGTKITYKLTERLGITLDYAYATLNSNIPGASYNRNLVSLGGTTKF